MVAHTINADVKRRRLGLIRGTEGRSGLVFPGRLSMVTTLTKSTVNKLTKKKKLVNKCAYPNFKELKIIPRFWLLNKSSRNELNNKDTAYFNYFGLFLLIKIAQQLLGNFFP